MPGKYIILIVVAFVIVVVSVIAYEFSQQKRSFSESLQQKSGPSCDAFNAAYDEYKQNLEEFGSPQNTLIGPKAFGKLGLSSQISISYTECYGTE